MSDSANGVGSASASLASASSALASASSAPASLATASAFNVSADGYDRLIGRYLPSLAPAFAEAAGVGEGADMRVLDVGCGPGGLTEELSKRVGQHNVAAIDPSAPFVQTCRTRLPHADVRQGYAEELPFDDNSFDASLASLVIGFFDDAERAATEMLRVTKQGGIIAACFWDFSHMPVLNAFWSAVTQLDPDAAVETQRLGSRDGEIAALFSRAGAHDVTRGVLQASTEYASFDDLWSPIEEGIGPVGQHYLSISEQQRDAVTQNVKEALNLPAGHFTLAARAWFACGKVPTL